MLMHRDRFFETIDAMETYGGSFVKALAECLRRADSINFKRLVDAFPDYLDQYHDIALKLKAQKAARKEE